MSKIETLAPKAAKAQETVEKTLKANQDAAAKAVKVGKETAEKALKASSEAVTKAYDQACSAAKETVQRTFPQAAARFEELAGVQRANLEAFFSAGTVAMKNAETMSGWLVIRIPTCSPGCTPSATSEDATDHARPASSAYVSRVSGNSSASRSGSRRALRSSRCPSGITSWANSMRSIGAPVISLSSVLPLRTGARGAP